MVVNEKWKNCARDAWWWMDGREEKSIFRLDCCGLWSIARLLEVYFVSCAIYTWYMIVALCRSGGELLYTGSRKRVLKEKALSSY